MLPTSVTIGLLLLTALILGYLLGHKKGMREGIELSEFFNKPPPPPKEKKEPVVELEEPPAPREKFGTGAINQLYRDGYSVTRGGVIFRGGLEIAFVGKEHGPFGFERIHDVREMKEDAAICRRLSRNWYETFALDEGLSLREDSYFVSNEGLFWNGDLLLYRLSDHYELEEWPVTSSTKYFKKPDLEDREACSRLLTRWKRESDHPLLPEITSSRSNRVGWVLGTTTKGAHSALVDDQLEQQRSGFPCRTLPLWTIAKVVLVQWL